MHGRFFTYDGEDSQAHSLAIAGLEQNDDVVFSLGREVFASQLNRYRNLVGHMGTRWNEVLVFNIQFIKDPCANASAANMYFTEDEVNDINAWLTSPDYPTLFHMYDYDFERDSSGNNLILFDCADDQFTMRVVASGYGTVDYFIEGGEYVGGRINQMSDEKTPSSFGDLIKYNGYYSFSCSDSEYMNSITKVVINDIEYDNIATNEWLSTYDSGGKMEHKYMLLIDTEKVLNNKYDYFGVFSDVQAQVIDGNVVGFNCTFTTNSPFAWTHEITQTVDGSATFTVNSAEKYREIYPLIEITPTKDQESSATRSKVKISNSVDGGEIELNLMQGSPTVLDSRRSIIKDATGIISFTDLGISDMDYIYWPKLYHGENTITITGGTATITYREPRKVGDY